MGEVLHGREMEVEHREEEDNKDKEEEEEEDINNNLLGFVDKFFWIC